MEVKAQNNFLATRNKELENKLANISLRLKFESNKSEKFNLLTYSNEKFLREKNDSLIKELSSTKKVLLEKID